jgi:predicted nucleic acid-binding protein
MDDLPARRLAARLGLRVVGTAGVLLAVKRLGFIVYIRPLLDGLDAAEFRLSRRVRAEVLDVAGEADPSQDTANP